MFSAAGSKKVKLGAQNCLWEEGGAYTGEISPIQLADLKCRYVIVGHSERKRYFFETNETANKKIKTAIVSKLTPIYCVGETVEEKNQGRTIEAVKKQIEAGLDEIETVDLKKILIAYEPVWAIGSGKACFIDDAREVSRFIKSALPDSGVLYGGSVNSDNAVSYLKEGGYNGLLVGGISLKETEFIKLIRKVEEI